MVEIRQQKLKEGIEMVELKGTEKQIAWATELRRVVVEHIEKGIEFSTKLNEKNLSTIEVIREEMKNNNSTYWIDNFKGTKEENLKPLFEYLNNKSITGRKIAKAINEMRGY